jgi:hypothetical protein
MDLIVSSRTQDPIVEIQALNYNWTDDLWEDVVNPQDPEHYDEEALRTLFPTSFDILSEATGLKRRRPADPDEPETAVTSTIDYQSHKRLRSNSHSSNPLGITTQNPTPSTTRSVIAAPFHKGIFVDQVIYTPGTRDWCDSTQADCCP